MTRRIVLAAAGAALLTLASQTAPAWAQGGPCVQDLKKFCRDTKPGAGRILNCLAAHEAELSAACKEHVERMKAQGRPGRGGQERAQTGGGLFRVCGNDIGKFCKDVQGGRGPVVECLQQYQTELSDACKTRIEQMTARGRGAGRGRGSGPAKPDQQ